MRTIETFENCINGTEQTVSYKLLQAYKSAKDNDLETVNFTDVIWKDEIAPLLDELELHGIDHIYISSGVSGLNATIYEFLKLGCSLAGMEEVATGTRWGGEVEKTPAFVIELN